ncbi:MAG: YbhB/YbcL family Raf kinase inhibitor-like protein [Ignavibacteria bacterium]|nr:YbhB/YbcL family Raf kinase inhibitor-like protein [Ignavibacteria bacterium]
MKFSIVFILILLICSCQKENPEQTIKNNFKSEERSNIQMKLTSLSFKDGELMSEKYTCDGENISPHLSWTGIPENTKSLALISDDPDAPVGDWVHWVIYNIPPAITELKEGFPRDKEFENGIKQGKNDFGKIGYDGPCPPGGTHRYYFKLYALDIVLEKDFGLTKKELLKLMEGHILAETSIMGKYKR